MKSFDEFVAGYSFLAMLVYESTPSRAAQSPLKAPKQPAHEPPPRIEHALLVIDEVRVIDDVNGAKDANSTLRPRRSKGISKATARFAKPQSCSAN
mmetsp:Transcript_14483/g.24109  ORF Transcript_14483/g.24109 Transcript_14483/m.24109 type:complete len:96 (-) Transcript_14483:27-314(-)